jgi:protein-L-isoaspartate O-methyltransferase
VRNVSIVQGDGSRVAFDSADVIYVNAGATKPAEAWLDRLTEGGRLILPMTAGNFQVVMYSRARCFASSAEVTIFSPGAFPP